MTFTECTDTALPWPKSQPIHCSPLRGSPAFQMPLQVEVSPMWQARACGQLAAAGFEMIFPDPPPLLLAGSSEAPLLSQKSSVQTSHI